MRYKHYFLGGFLLAAAAVLPHTAVAAPPRIELILSSYRIVPGMDTTYVHTYTPRLEYGTSAGTARQVLELKAKSLSGFGAGIVIRPGRRIGFQLLFDSFSTDLEGSGGPYVLSLQYESRQPPSYELRTYTYERTSPRPPARGTLKETAVSLNVLFRIPAGRILALDLSAGPSLFFVSAAAESPTFTKFRLGGHSVLFSEDTDLKLEIPRSTRLGVNAGIDVLVFAGRRLAFGAGIRRHICPAYKARGELAILEQPGGYFSEIDLAAENIPVSPLRMNPSYVKLGLSVRIRI